MTDATKKSILDMAMGAIKERTDIEMSKIVDNIIDPNTIATKTRTMTLKLEFIPSNDRKNVSVKATATTKLQPYAPLTTSLYVGADENGEIGAVEMVKQLPGQMNMNGEIQQEPSRLKLVK